MDKEKPKKKGARKVKKCPKCGVETVRLVVHDWRVHSGKPSRYTPAFPIEITE
jgi:ribosomal protein S27AE